MTDVFDNYLAREGAEPPADRLKRKGLSGERGRHIPAGTKIRDLEILGPDTQQGRYGSYWNRQYRVKCIVKHGDQECGRELTVTYGQLYYSHLISNCGCKPLAKHPPIRLEGLRFGRVEVMRWEPEDGGGWEIVCHECGALMYRETKKEVALAGQSCDGHEPQDRPNRVRIAT